MHGLPRRVADPPWILWSWRQFWAVYKKVASEYDEFLERHDGDMDIVLIFVSVLVWSILRSEHGIHYLLRAYNGSTTNALLTQIITLVVVKSNGISIGDGFPLPVLPAYLRRASLGPDPGICQSLLRPPCCLRCHSVQAVASFLQA
jgi:hypothetical protein